MDKGNKRDLPNLEDDEEPTKRTSCSCSSCPSCKSQHVPEAGDTEELVSFADFLAAQRKLTRSFNSYISNLMLAVGEKKEANVKQLLDMRSELPKYKLGFKSQHVLESDDVELVSAEDYQKAKIRKLDIQRDSMMLADIEKEEANAKANVKQRFDVTYKEPKVKLVFVNPIIPSIIYTGNEVVAVDGKPLAVEIHDAINFREIKTGPLSMVQVEIFVAPGDQYGETHRVSDFTKNILFQRDGRRPLIVGEGRKFYLKDGVGSIENLSFTDNSSWTKSKTFRLVAKVVDGETLSKFLNIEEAISEPFRVLDQRGEANKKHPRPREEDEVWRLKGISKNGIYHNRLLSKNIKTVGDFLKTHDEMGGNYLKELLGNNVPKKTWNVMVHNALECISQKVPTKTRKVMVHKNASATVPVVSFNPTIEQNLVINEPTGVAFSPNFTFQDFDFLFEDWSLLPHGEAFNLRSPHPCEGGNTSTLEKSLNF